MATPSVRPAMIQEVSGLNCRDGTGLVAVAVGGLVMAGLITVPTGS